MVENLEAAIAEVSNALGVEFETPRNREIDGAPFRIAYTLEGPPYLELIERSPGTPFTTLGMHHVGYWDDELAEAWKRLDRDGLRLEANGRPFGLPFTVHRGDRSGLGVELVDAALREAREGRG